MCPAKVSTMIFFVEVYYNGSDQIKIEMLGFPSKLSNYSADSIKLCPFLKIQLENSTQHKFVDRELI